MNSSILADARANYNLAAVIPQVNLPQNSNRWTLFQQDMRRLIGEHADETQAIAHAQTCGFDHRGPIAGNEQRIRMSRHCLIYEYPHFADVIDKFSDSPVSIPSTLGSLGNGRFFSDIMYFHMFYILTMQTYRSNIDTVCEIGGGYGAPARMWLQNPIRPLKNYTIVDLPESLFYAEVFLRSACPEANIVYCRTEADCRNTTTNTIYLVPIALAQFTKAMRFDLVTNTGSLGELSDDWVRYWARWLNEQNCSLFYSHNYFGISVDRIFESRNVIAPLTPPGWRVGQVRMNHPLMLLQSVGRNAAEIVLTRSACAGDQTWIYDVLKLQEEEKLTLRDLAYYIFNLPPLEQCNVAAELTLANKAIDDLTIFPKELIHILDRITSAPTFNTLPEADRNEAATTLARMREIYADNFPQGRNAA